MTSSRHLLHRATGAAGVFGAVLATPAAGVADAWSAGKCELYAAAWTRALDLHVDAGLGAVFMESQRAFIGSGCADGPETCPTSEAEIRVAET